MIKDLTNNCKPYDQDEYVTSRLYLESNKLFHEYKHMHLIELENNCKPLCGYRNDWQFIETSVANPAQKIKNITVAM